MARRLHGRKLCPQTALARSAAQQPPWFGHIKWVSRLWYNSLSLHRIRETPLSRNDMRRNKSILFAPILYVLVLPVGMTACTADSSLDKIPTELGGLPAN